MEVERNGLIVKVPLVQTVAGAQTVLIGVLYLWILSKAIAFFLNLLKGFLNSGICFSDYVR